MAALVIIDLVVEVTILPLLYRDVPIPFQATAKPIGDSLFSVTFLQLTLIASNILVFIAVLKRIKYRSDSIPTKNVDWLDLIAFLALAASGLAMWFYPIFLMIFLGAGIYLFLTEMR